MPSVCIPGFPALLTSVAESNGFDALFGSSRGSDSGKLDIYTVTIQFDDKPKSSYLLSIQAEDTEHAREKARDHLGIADGDAMSADGEVVAGIDLGGDTAWFE